VRDSHRVVQVAAALMFVGTENRKCQSCYACSSGRPKAGSRS
jgi:hypothetical protein